MNKKIVVIIIFCIAVIAHIALPISGSKIEIKNDKIALKTNDIDWWPMYQHDFQHTGHSNSVGPGTNHTNWIQDLDINEFFSGLIVVNGRIYSGGKTSDMEEDHGMLRCLDAYSGNPLWTQMVYGTFGIPCFNNNKIFVSHIYWEGQNPIIEWGSLKCYNAGSGSPIWSIGPFSDTYYGCPIVTNDRLYVGLWSSDNNIKESYSQLLCCYASNGTEIFSFTVNGIAGGFTIPTIVDNFIYVGLGQTQYCINLDGNIVWTYTLESQDLKFDSDTSCVVVDDKVYFTIDDWFQPTPGSLYCLDALNGNLIWKYTVGLESDGDLRYLPVIVDEYVYVSIGMDIYCFDADPFDDSIDEGFDDPDDVNYDIVWIHHIDTYINDDLAAADMKLYVNADGTIYCINTFSGNRLWDYYFSNHGILSSPVIADGKLFIGHRCSYVEPGRIYCFSNPSIPDISVQIDTEMTQVPRGTHFIFNVTIINNEFTSQTLTVWSAAERLSDGKIYEPLLGPITINLYPGEIKQFKNVHSGVGNVIAPYRYFVRVGEACPGPLWAEDYIEGEVIP